MKPRRTEVNHLHHEIDSPRPPRVDLSGQESNDFHDNRDNFLRVYFSLLPFLGLEYFAEINQYPSGMVFPLGFLLFWAFYYTYYQPGVLEEQLGNASDWNFFAIPSILMGVILWFVKATLIEIGNLLLLRWVKFKPKPARTRPRPAPAQARRPQAPSLPPEVQDALAVLGMQNCRDWRTIHQRYRQLAKQYHPDLNPDLTDVGRRFMRIDSAYRTLCAYPRYFHR